MTPFGTKIFAHIMFYCILNSEGLLIEVPGLNFHVHVYVCTYVCVYGKQFQYSIVNWYLMCMLFINLLTKVIAFGNLTTYGASAAACQYSKQCILLVHQ